MANWKISIEDTNGVVTERNIELSSEMEELLEEEEDLWCDCGGAEDPNIEPEYVEDYMGVSHGWICPNCGKFVQIG